MTIDVSDRPSDLTAAHIRSVRRIRGWTADRLAAECSGVGAPEITRSVIANIESGRKGESGERTRDVTVDELVAISRAFGMGPLIFLSAALREPAEILQYELHIANVPDKGVRQALREAARAAEERGHVTWLVHRDQTHIAAIVSVDLAMGAFL